MIPRQPPGARLRSCAMDGGIHGLWGAAHILSAAFRSSFHCLNPFWKVLRTTTSSSAASSTVCSHSGQSGLNSTPAEHCHEACN